MEKPQVIWGDPNRLWHEDKVSQTFSGPMEQLRNLKEILGMRGDLWSITLERRDHVTGEFSPGSVHRPRVHRKRP